MRHLRFLPIGLIVLFSCARENLSEPMAQSQGDVEISLSASDSGTEIKPASKSVEDYVPLPDDFEIEIYNARGIRLYRDTYANSVGRKIPLNSGDYRILAQHGDSSGIGFGASWFAADEQFTVHPQTSETISLVAKMSKVKVAVNHGLNLIEDYSELYSLVKLDADDDKALKFVEDEARSGYIPAGMLTYELYVQESDGKWKYFHLDPKQYAPNDFVTFNVDINRGQGSLGTVTLNVDVTVDGVTKEYEIPAEMAPQDAPAINLRGFTDSSFSFIEGMEYPGTQVDCIVMSTIAKCELSSPYFVSEGLPETIDLASPELSADVTSTLRSLGFRWVREMAGKRMGSVDFSAIGLYNKYDPASVFSGSFTLCVTDAIGRTAETAFNISQKPASVEFAPQSYNAFAKRFKGFSASTPDGNADKVSIQYSLDGESWIDVKKSSLVGGISYFPDIDGLAPGTQYQLRAVYNDNPACATAPVTLTTEQELQVGNAGFEEWTDEEFKFTAVIPKKSVTWYRPWNDLSSSWWDSNSKQTLHGYYSLVGNQNSRVFPCVAYTVIM